MLRLIQLIGDPRAGRAYQKVNLAQVKRQEMPIGHWSVPSLARPADITD